MRVLQLCNKIPFPPLDGGSIVMNNTTESLLGLGCTVHLMAIDTPKRPIDLSSIPQDYRKKTKLTVVKIDTQLKPISALKNLIFSDLPYHVSRYISYDFEEKLIELLEAHDFDVVQIEALYMMIYEPIIRKYSAAKVILRAQNVEFKIWEKYKSNLPFSLKKIYLHAQIVRLKKFEIEAFHKVDGIIAITEYDRNIIADLCKKTPVIAIPLGINLNKFPKPKASKQLPIAFHLGSMDWYPNLEAVEWFLKKVYPIIKRKAPKLKIALAGTHMPKLFLELANENLQIEAHITDPKNYMQHKSIMIVPLQSGSGIRVKILEGMAIGKAVLSTTIGAEGIAYTAGKNIIIADTATEFATTLIELYQNTALQYQLGQNARYLIENQYNQEKLANRFLDFFKEKTNSYANI